MSSFECFCCDIHPSEIHLAEYSVKNYCMNIKEGA